MAVQEPRREGKSVYRSTIDRMNAASITRTVAFSSPACQSAFTKGFYIVSRNVWFVAILGPIIVGDEKADAAEKVIMQSVKKIKEEVENKEAQLREIVKGYGYKDSAAYAKPYQFEADVFHPVANRYLDLMESVDRVFALATTLWIKEDIEKTARVKIELDMRKKFVQILNTSRAAYNTVLKAAKHRNEAAAAKVEAVVEAAENADGTMNDQQAKAFQDATDELRNSANPEDLQLVQNHTLSPDLMTSVSEAHDARMADEAAAAAAEKKPRARKKDESSIPEAAE